LHANGLVLAEFVWHAARHPDTYETDPLSPVIGASLGMILFLARRYDQAAEVLKRAQEITPDHFLPHMRMGLLRIQQRTYDVRRSDP
jgi:hypothetical protein